MTTVFSKLSELIGETITIRVKPPRNRLRAAGSVLCFWAVRHKPTGHYLPEVYGRAGRGGSHVEPEDKLLRRPRLFNSPRGAKAYLGQWLRGAHECSRGYDAGSPYSESEYYEETSVRAVDSRKREDMEIVELRLDLP